MSGVKNFGAAAFAALVAVGGWISAPQPASAQQVVIKFGHPLIRSALDNWAETFRDRLANRVGNRVKVEIYPGSQLGAIPRMVEGAQLGTIEMIGMPPEFLSGVDARFSVVPAPGIFTDVMHGYRTAHDPEFMKAFWSLGENKGVKIVGFTCDAPSEYVTLTPVRRLDDFKGRKIRVFASRLEVETMRRLGATGVPMPMEDVLPALQTRQIDGNKASIAVFVPFKYQTIAKFVLRPRESLICTVKAASAKWFAGLPLDLRAIITEEALKTDELNQQWTLAFLERMYKIWVEGGGELIELSPADQAELRRRLATVGDDVLKDRPEVKKVYDVMKAAAARVQR